MLGGGRAGALGDGGGRVGGGACVRACVWGGGSWEGGGGGAPLAPLLITLRWRLEEGGGRCWGGGRAGALGKGGWLVSTQCGEVWGR